MKLKSNPARFFKLFLLTLLTIGPFLSLLPIPNALASRSGDANWPTFGHDATRSHRTSEPLPMGNDDKLHLQWAYSFGERVEIEVQPIVADGLIYVGAMNGVMTALQASDGSAAWSYQAGGPIPHTASVAGGRLYFGALDGAVYALDASDGRLLWRYQTDGPVLCAPAVVDNRVYIGSSDGSLYTLDSSSGSELWRYATGGPVTGAPAVANGRVYFGSEDMKARAVNATTGQKIWERELGGFGMRQTHPVVSDDGAVVIFQTTKPGRSSYTPYEAYPNASSSANPVSTWNTFYQNHPSWRSLYFLDANDGRDLWNPGQNRYVSMPIPYWGLVPPVLDSQGRALIPAPAGTSGHRDVLDHDNRLFRVDLSTGQIVQIAGSEFQLRPDEAGRPTVINDEYVYTISEDVGTYRPSSGSKETLFGTPVHGFHSHMDPLAPLPSKHLWRYGGVIAMGGAPNASPLVVADGQAYYVSYGWLYALGPTDRGYDPDGVTPLPFTSRDERANELTYLQANPLTYAEIKDEVETRVAAILAAGHLDPIAKFEQTGNGLVYNETSPFQSFGHEAELVRVLSEALPYVSSALKSDLLTYLKSEAANYLFDPDEYSYRYDILRYGEGFEAGGGYDITTPIYTRWWADNPNMVGERLYAMWVYAEATSDWSYVNSQWSSLIKPQFQKFLDAYNPARGFAEFEHWRVGRLNVNSQVGAALGVLKMAQHRGDSTTQNQAQSLLDDLLDGRTELGHFVRDLYDNGVLYPATIGIDTDGTLHNDDVMTYYNNGGNLIPYDQVRNRTSDVRQVNWWDASGYKIHASASFQHYQALVGYYPMYPELAEALRTQLLPETQAFVQSYEVNDPWWWLSDLGHHKSAGGEHLFNSPTLAYGMFQAKAWVLREDWDSLRRQLPLAYSPAGLYDLYRLHNLVTLLQLADVPSSDLSGSYKSAAPTAARQGDQVRYTIELIRTGEPLTRTVRITDTLPTGLSYVHGSLTPVEAAYQAGQITWSGYLSDTDIVRIQYTATVLPSGPTTLINQVEIGGDPDGLLTRSETIIANPFQSFLSLVLWIY